MRTIDIHEAKANLCHLVEQAAGGKSFLIGVAGTPRVMVIPAGTSEVGQMRRLGFLERTVCVAEDFDQMGRAEIERLFGGS